jgi:hypothetical protein
MKGVEVKSDFRFLCEAIRFKTQESEWNEANY